MKLDYIIPIYNLKKHRLRNLVYHKDIFLNKQEDVDINLHIVVQDKKTHPIFNKQWLCNIGVRDSTTDHIIIADLDVYIQNNDKYLSMCMHIIKALNLRWAFLWNKVKYMTEDGLSYTRHDWPEPFVNEGCIVYFQRSLWEEMGGANEWIRELRGPDNDLALRARYLTGTHYGLPFELIHSWHPISPMKRSKFKKNNLEILKYTRKHPEEVIKLLKKQNWGNINAPYCDNMSFYEARVRG